MVFSFNHQVVRPGSEILPGLNRYVLSGYNSIAFANEYQEFLIQEIHTDHARMIYSVHHVEKPTNIHISENGPFLFVCLALQQDMHLEINGLGDISLREGQFNILYHPSFNILRHFENRKEYIALGIQYDVSIFKEWQPYFPLLTDFLERLEKGEAAMLLEHPQWLTKEIQDTIYKLTHSELPDPAKSVYIDLLLKTLLFHLLYQAVQQQPASTYSNYEIEGIHAASEMIRKNLRYHFVIREIAQKVGMNEFKLKNGFRELYGNGVYEYLRTERMQEARLLLAERARSIKEIAAHTGYRSVNSFIKAFKKKYAQTPGEFRKQYRNKF